MGKFGVYVFFVQLRTVLKNKINISSFWYMQLLYSSEPKVLHNNQSLLFWYMYFCYSSEPQQGLQFNKLGFWYMHLCTTPNCCHCIHFAAQSSFWYMCFVQLRTCNVSSKNFSRFWYMRICTAPNRVSDAQVKACRFGICVFAQLRTS